MGWFGAKGEAAVDPAARERLAETVHRRLAEDVGRLGLPSPDDRVIDERVIDAIRNVPREAFVPRGSRDQAFIDAALPLGHGQTVSQPSVLALMTAALGVRAGDRVLEIGVGSGYQTAVLAQIGARVFGIEHVPELLQGARARLAGLGVTGVTLRCGDGARGWPEEAPFDGILAACAARSVQDALLTQLRAGGRMVLPVGPPSGPQQLVLITKDRAGRLAEKPLIPVMFVPMVGS